MNKAKGNRVMSAADSAPLDVLGIGFGPSNLALAIALQERARQLPTEVTFGFVEKQRSFAWHGHMLLDDSRMQISFLKDLVTLRDPTSPFTFINYLHEHKRLEDFINLKTFFPVRTEYNRYLQWASSHFTSCCAYGERAVAVEPQLSSGTVTALRVTSVTAEGIERQRLTSNLVVAVGGTAHIPASFAEMGDQRVFHSSTYLESIAAVLASNSSEQLRVAVLGGGQSAGEIFLDLQRFPETRADLISRGPALKPADDSPLMNEIFHPQFTDVIFRQPPQARSALLQDFRGTNYGVIDLDLIERIHEMLYLQKVSGRHRHDYLRACEVRKVTAEPDGVHLILHHTLTGLTETRCYDAVVLATGYERQSHHALLADLCPYIGDFTVDRHYRLQHRDDFLPEIYLQGSCEPTHGLSDTLLSVLPIRSKEIVDSLMSVLPRQRSVKHQVLDTGTVTVNGNGVVMR